ncbi:MAG: hypothetical protein PWP67_2334 [Clostridium butyricum]|nr:hypothetical protein [Clostridium butyricum]
MIYGQTITKIGSKTLCNYSNLTTETIPDSVTSIAIVHLVIVANMLNIM